MTQHTPDPAPQQPPSTPSSAPPPSSTGDPAPLAPPPGDGGSRALAPTAADATAGRGLRRAGGWVFWIGVALTLAAGIFAIIAVFMLARIPANAVNSAVSLSPPSATVELQAGDSRLLAWDGAGPEACTATSPSGQDVLLTGSNYGHGAGNQPGQGSPNPDDYDNVGVISASESGAYTIECSGQGAVMFDLGDVGYAVNWGLGLVVAFVIGSLTSLVVIIGGILWLVGRSQQLNR